VDAQAGRGAEVSHWHCSRSQGQHLQHHDRTHHLRLDQAGPHRNGTARRRGHGRGVPWHRWPGAPARVFHARRAGVLRGGPGFLSLSDDEAVAAKYSGTEDGEVAIIFELELGKASLGAEVARLSQFPRDRERLLPPRTHFQVFRGPTRRADGVTVVRVRPTLFQNVRTVEEVAGAPKGEIIAHVKGMVADLRNDYFYPDVSKRDRADLDDVLDSGLGERLAALEQHLLARFCKYEPEWYHDNGMYKSVSSECCARLRTPGRASPTLRARSPGSSRRSLRALNRENCRWVPRSKFTPCFGRPS
jgi:hypothetical protein